MGDAVQSLDGGNKKSAEDGDEKNKKEKALDFSRAFFLVEVTGFEPATFWSRTKRATKLRYTSINLEPMRGLEPLTC